MTKLLHIDTTATAWIRERWTFTVPDGWQIPDDPDEQGALLDTLIAAHEDEQVTYEGVENVEIWDEQDREIREITLEDQ